MSGFDLAWFTGSLRGMMDLSNGDFIGDDDDTVDWLFESCVLYVYPFPRLRLSPILPWRGPIDLKNHLVDGGVVIFSSLPWTVHQYTLKGFVLFDHVSRLFIALTGIAFEILPPTPTSLSVMLYIIGNAFQGLTA